MPAEEPFLREVSRRTTWKSVKGLWTEALNPNRFKLKAPATAPDTAPDPPAPLIMRDASLVTGRFGEAMMVIDRNGEPTLLIYRSPTYSAPPPVFASDRSPTPSTPRPSLVITDHASELHVTDHSPPPHAPHNPNPFDWRKGFYLGMVMLCVFVAWRFYRRWGNGGGDQGYAPQADAGLDRHGLVDAFLAPTVAGYEGGRYILRQRNLANLPTMTELSALDHKVKVGEVLFGPQAWERFDILVPRRFPYEGMEENPVIVFLNPKVIQGGDAAGAQVVAPELARSWTGDLITHQINEDLLLNEDFITYAKRRIVEVVQGDKGNGWIGFNRMMERSNNNQEFVNMAGFDPDEMLLCHIERKIGLPAFVEFQKNLISTYKFKSIDVAAFNEFLKSNVPGVDYLDMWIEGTGIPSDALQPNSAANSQICMLAAEFKNGRIPSEDEVADWGGREWELYLANLCTDDVPSQVTALDERYKLSKSPYYKVQIAFFRIAGLTGFNCCFSGVDKCLKIVGRMKYLQLNRREQIQRPAI